MTEAAGTPLPRWARVWKGRTSPAQYDAYAAYLYAEGVCKIRAIPGNLGVQMLRRLTADFAEFSVTSYWPDLEAIQQFAGTDISLARHLPRDSEYLLDLPKHVKHFEIYDAATEA